MTVEILFNSSKSLPPKYERIEFGKYAIRTIATLKESLLDTHEHLILQFDDIWKEKIVAYLRNMTCRIC